MYLIRSILRYMKTVSIIDAECEFVLDTAMNNENFLAILLESQINFKQGSKGRWERTYTVVYSNFLTVFADENKSIELFTFHPDTSTISFTDINENSLFLLKDEASPMLFLFECGSDLMLKTWLKTLKVAGWNSPTINRRYIYPQKLLDKPPSWIDSSASLNSSLNISSRKNLAPLHHTTTSMERSSSLPTLSSIENIQPRNTPQNDKTKHRRDKKFKTENRYSKLLNQKENASTAYRGGISESGYCSNESLLIPDNEKYVYKQRQLATNNRNAVDDLVSIS